MNHKATWALFLFAATALGGTCQERQRAVLCVASPIPSGAVASDAFDAEDLGCVVDPAANDGDEANLVDCNLSITEEGQSFVLLHQLPEGVMPIGDLSVRIDTPCPGADQVVDIKYAGQVAVLSGVVPPGGSCAFSITATIAGSELRCDHADAANCNDIVCPEETPQ